MGGLGVFQRSRCSRLLVASSLTILAGCGSTVSGSSSSFGPPTANVPGQSSNSESGHADTAGGLVAPPVRASGPDSSRGAAPVAASTQRAGAPGSVGRVGAGAPAGPLLVGYYGTEATNGNTMGINGQALGDPVTIGNALADWVNAHGGAGGRKIKLIFAKTQLVSSQPQDQVDQSACAKFTEDNRVFAVLSVTLTTPVMYGCLAKRNVLYLANTAYTPDQAFYMAHANTLFSTAVNQDRAAVAAADGLWRAGYFSTGRAKVGVVTSDHRWFKSGTEAFVREVSKHGVQVSDFATVCHSPCSTQEQTAEAQSGVLRFQSDGITHVVFLSAEATYAWMRVAASIGYTPSYGLNSNDTPSLLPVAVPASAFAGGAIGAGYSAAMDVARAQNPALNPQTQLCESIMKAAGVNMAAAGAELQAWMTCDGFFLLKAMLDRAGAANYGLMRQALEGIGSALLPANGWTAWYGPHRHDGGQTYRLFHYSSGCHCFKYTSNREYPIPPLSGQSR